jgi:hypothetical protein
MRSLIRRSLALGASALLLSSMTAYADDISNKLDSSIDAVAEVMALNVGGASGTTQLYVVPQNDDGKNGCNLTGKTTLVVSLISSDTSFATVSPASLTFTSCGDAPTLTVTPHAQGSATITATLVSNDSGGTFNLASVTFTVNVAPPANTAPTVRITGVTGGARYEIGSVPGAMCQVTDAEDGDRSFAATLSAVTGTLSALGLGDQTASCSYTDGGGLIASASVTYGIVDTTAPVISFVSRTPANSHGWNNGDVTVTWSCADSVSGPVDASVSQTVNSEGASQSATGTCRDHAGNSASDTQSGIKIDKTAPAIEDNGPTPNSPDGLDGWYRTEVTNQFTASDLLSGLAGPSLILVRTGSAEGTNVVVGSGDVSDLAGNTVAGIASAAFKIDLGNPVITLVSRTLANDNDWNKDDVTVTWSCTDSVSGPVDGSISAIVKTEGAPQSATGTCRDLAGNSASDTQSGIKIDKTAPTIVDNGPTTKEPNGQNGWYTTAVTNEFTALDNVSGLPAGTNPILASTGLAEGTAIRVKSGDVSDLAGNTVHGIDSVAFNIDLSDPVITVVSRTPANSHGWNRDDVTVLWSCTDRVSGAVEPSVSLTLSSQGADQSATGTCYDLAGNSASDTQSGIKIDKTAPTIVDNGPTPKEPNGQNGWYTTAVRNEFTASDDLSGLPAGTNPIVVSTGLAEGTGIRVNSGDVSDLAGNIVQGIESAAFSIDLSNPVITFVSRTQANSHGWNRDDVTITWSCADGVSGAVDGSISAIVNTEGVDQPATGTCHDRAGNSAADTQSGINIDWTAPTIADVGPTPNSPNGQNGWYTTAVRNEFTASDGLSGFPAHVTSIVVGTGSAEGTGLRVNSGDVSDLAGNTADGIDSAALKVDLSDPVVSLVGGPADGGSYYFGSVPAAPDCSASDAVSGPAGCSVSGYVTAVGQHTVTAKATDNAGRSATVSASYSVLAWTVRGFYSPVDMIGTLNTVRGGSTVPMKFEVFAGSSELTSPSVVSSFKTGIIACSTVGAVPTDEIEITTTGGTTLRYDASAGQFIQNWQTPKAAGVCYRTTMSTIDGTSISAYFKTK